MKIKLHNQYQEWQEKIENDDIGVGDIHNARISEISFKKDLKTHQVNINHAILKAVDERVEKELTFLDMDIDHFIYQLNEKVHTFVRLAKDIIKYNGLTPERIQQFEHLTADESFVDDKYAICMEEIIFDKNMMRLDCDGQHTFCQVCIEGWFANHKTCPICRHKFSRFSSLKIMYDFNN